jgi:hypothetical protein
VVAFASAVVYPFCEVDFIEGVEAAWGIFRRESSMSHFFREILRYGDHLGPHGWFWVLAAMILVGVICLRGFGSRSQY